MRGDTHAPVADVAVVAFRFLVLILSCLSRSMFQGELRNDFPLVYRCISMQFFGI